MSKIEKALIVLDKVETGEAVGYFRVDCRALLIVTIAYLAIMLSVHIEHIDILLWFAVYPIIVSPLLGISYAKIFLQSLIVLPIVLLIAVFNPIIDRTPVIVVGDFSISNGWLSFWGIILRGLFSMQALLIMIHSVGFTGMVRGMEKLGVPKFLTTQLLMVFRYIKVLIEEGMVMKFAREARSFGKKHLSLKNWGVLTGQLFIRSYDRAERVNRAMLSRGFSGYIPTYSVSCLHWKVSDTLFVVVNILAFIFLRLFNLSLLFVQ